MQPTARQNAQLQYRHSYQVDPKPQPRAASRPDAPSVNNESLGLAWLGGTSPPNPRPSPTCAQSMQGSQRAQGMHPQDHRQGHGSDLRTPSKHDTRLPSHARVSPPAEHRSRAAPPKPHATGPVSPYASAVHPKPRGSKPRWQEALQACTWSGSDAPLAPRQPAAPSADTVQAPGQRRGGGGHSALQGAALYAARSTIDAASAATPHTAHAPRSGAAACSRAQWPNTVRPRPTRVAHGGPAGNGRGGGQRPQAATWASPRCSAQPAPTAASRAGNRRAAWLHAAVQQGTERGAELQPLQFNTEGECRSPTACLLFSDVSLAWCWSRWFWSRWSLVKHGAQLMSSQAQPVKSTCAVDPLDKTSIGSMHCTYISFHTPPASAETPLWK